jgi:hypothetical protein
MIFSGSISYKRIIRQTTKKPVKKASIKNKPKDEIVRPSILAITGNIYKRLAD